MSSLKIKLPIVEATEIRKRNLKMFSELVSELLSGDWLDMLWVYRSLTTAARLR